MELIFQYRNQKYLFGSFDRIVASKNVTFFEWKSKRPKTFDKFEIEVSTHIIAYLDTCGWMDGTIESTQAAAYIVTLQFLPRVPGNCGYPNRQQVNRRTPGKQFLVRPLKYCCSTFFDRISRALVGPVYAAL